MLMENKKLKHLDISGNSILIYRKLQQNDTLTELMLANCGISEGNCV